MSFQEDEGFELVAPEQEPPEGAAELALQAEAVDTEGVAPAAPAPPVVGRTYKLDLNRGRLMPEGGQPLAIRGEAAMRQAVEKALRTERGSSDVLDDDYGIEPPEEGDEVRGQPFDAAAFSDLETRTRDALLALPWVLDVTDFNAAGSASSTEAFVSFRVVPEGEADPFAVENYPLPIT